MFGEDPHKSNSYSRIISEGHLERLISYMDHVSNRTHYYQQHKNFLSSLIVV
jgi:hypothetical protein